jgi:hypothetical protein
LLDYTTASIASLGARFKFEVIEVDLLVEVGLKYRT